MSGRDHPPRGSRSSSGRDRWSGDAGQVAGIEAIPFGLLVFVIGTLLVANAWGVVDAKMAATSAAREAVRAYVESPDQGTAEARARAAATSAMVGHGRDAAGTSVTISHHGGRPFARCTRATVTVSHPVPALQLPFLGGRGHAFDVRASASEVVDPYRSGLPGEATC